MKSKNKFAEIKIRMVMKLKKLNRAAAVEEISKGESVHAEMMINRDVEGELVSAEEFFGED